MIYELRVYHCVPGRLPDLLKRFDTITLKLWDKHGIKQAGFWTVLVGESNQDLYYLLKWESLAEREQKFGAFGADPEWLAARAETEKNGPIVASIANSFLAPTSFSSVK
jgi:NIPSNAP